MKPALLAICTVLSIGAAAPASANITVYRDKAAYMAAVRIGETITFDGGTGAEESMPANSFSDSAAFGMCGKPGPSCAFQGVGGVRREADALKYEPYSTHASWINGYLHEPVAYQKVGFAIGFDITGDTTGANFFLENLEGPVYSWEAFSLNGETGFFGVVTTKFFDSFGWSKYAINPGYEKSFYIDNVYLAPAVPEPSSVLLMLAGLACVSAYRRKAVG